MGELVYIYQHHSWKRDRKCNVTHCYTCVMKHTASTVHFDRKRLFFYDIIDKFEMYTVLEMESVFTGCMR